MASLNKITIIGNLGRDPEMRFTPNGNPVTSFSVAVSSSYKQDGEWVKETEWFNVTTWDKLAELCNERLSKGQSVYVEGKVKLRQWDGKDGVKHSSLDIVAHTVLFLDKKADTGKVETVEDAEVETDDIPF